MRPNRTARFADRADEIAQAIVDEIVSGNFPAGQPLPSIRELVSRFAPASKATVNIALDRLALSDYIEGRNRSRYIVLSEAEWLRRHERKMTLEDRLRRDNPSVDSAIRSAFARADGQCECESIMCLMASHDSPKYDRAHHRDRCTRSTQRAVLVPSFFSADNPENYLVVCTGCAMSYALDSEIVSLAHFNVASGSETAREAARRLPPTLAQDMIRRHAQDEIPNA